MLHLHSHYLIWENSQSGVTPTQSLSYMREQTIRCYTYTFIILHRGTIRCYTYTVIILYKGTDNQVLHLHSHYFLWENRHSGVIPTQSLSYMRKQTIRCYTFTIIILSDNQVLHLHSHYLIMENRKSGVTPTLSYLILQSRISGATSTLSLHNMREQTIRYYTYIVSILYEGTDNLV